jgi:hypothetical protein
MNGYSSKRGFLAARLFSVAGICLITASLPVPAVAGQHFYRRYEATAYVSIFSINIFTRSAVGFGYAKADEEAGPDGRLLSLQFLSGSIPSRAHGLNRFGFIQEDIEERDHHVCAAAQYFGLITASKEESLAQARVALETKSATTAFVAAKASIDAHSARYSVRHLDLPSAYRGADAEQLLDEVRAAFDHPENGEPEHVQSLNGRPIGTFLYSVREAMLSPEAKVQRRFIYNGRTFTLLADKREDDKTGHELYAHGLIEQPAHAVLLTGAIRNEQTKDTTAFKLWFDRTTPDLLPLRFEFRPKSFLRLVFKAVLATGEPPNRTAADSSP